MAWWQRCPLHLHLSDLHLSNLLHLKRKKCTRTHFSPPHLYTILCTSEKPFVSFWHFWSPLQRCLSFWRGWIRMPGYFCCSSHQLFALFYFFVCSIHLKNVPLLVQAWLQFWILRLQLVTRWAVVCTSEMVVHNEHILSSPKYISVHHCRSKWDGNEVQFITQLPSWLVMLMDRTTSSNSYTCAITEKTCSSFTSFCLLKLWRNAGTPREALRIIWTALWSEQEPVWHSLAPKVTYKVDHLSSHLILTTLFFGASFLGGGRQDGACRLLLARTSCW